MNVQCLLCKEIIGTSTVHKLEVCKCTNCYIIKGKYYIHYGGKNLNKIQVIFNKEIKILANNREKCNKKYEEWEEKNAYQILVAEKK